MENNQNNKKSGEEKTKELPLHFRLTDIYMEQVEKSVPVMTTMLEDIQSIYIKGMHMALKAGQMVEERSKMNMGFYKSAGKSFEAAIPVITEAQLGVTKAIVDSACKTIRMMRRTITDQKQ